VSSTPDASIPGPVAGFIAGARVGRLATADADGQPTVVPICYAFDGRALYSAVDAKPKQAPPEGLKRIRNLRENPRVSVVIDEYDEDWTRLRYVIAEGTAALLTGGEEFGRAVDLLRAKYPQYRAMGLDRAGGWVIAIAPARFLSWRFDPGAGPDGPPLPPDRVLL
jgi:PPOX class probable F420-dependent enzyme